MRDEYDLMMPGDLGFWAVCMHAYINAFADAAGREMIDAPTI